MWKKLNLKQHEKLYIEDPYGAMQPHVDEVAGSMVDELTADVDFYLGFARALPEVDEHTKNVSHLAASDPVVWIAYPKQSSKRYTCEFNRDSGWDGLGLIGYEPVRQVAIDEDWSAIRFRKVQHIKTMVRTFAMTEEGKKKAKGANVPDSS